MEQVWPGDNSSKNAKLWPPILGSSSNSPSIVSADGEKDGIRMWKCLLLEVVPSFHCRRVKLKLALTIAATVLHASFARFTYAILSIKGKG